MECIHFCKSHQPEVKEIEIGDGEYSGRKRPAHEVVADIELVQKGEIGDGGGGDGAPELVGVGMEEGEVGELREEVVDGVGAEAIAIEVNGSEGSCRGVVWGVGAVEAFVGSADVGSDPCLGDAKWVGGDVGFELLDDLVGQVDLYVDEIRGDEVGEWGRGLWG